MKYKTIKDYVDAYIINNNLTIKEFCKVNDISYHTLYSLKRTNKKPQNRTLIKLANAMGDPSLQYKLYEIYEKNKDK